MSDSALRSDSTPSVLSHEQISEACKNERPRDLPKPPDVFDFWMPADMKASDEVLASAMPARLLPVSSGSFMDFGTSRIMLTISLRASWLLTVVSNTVAPRRPRMAPR